MIENYLIHLLILISIYVVLAVSLNLTIGFVGLLNLGHAAFFGIGAYTSALLIQQGVPFILAFLIAGAITSIFGYLLMLAVKNLKGDYLALATLGFNFVIYSILLNWTELTRGPLGIPGIPKPSIFGFVINTNLEYMVFSLIIATVVVLILHGIIKSPFGKLLHGIRDNEIRLKVLGKDTFHIKTKVMMLSAFIAGIAGSLYAHYITYIDPSSFTMAEVILVFTIVIIGGLASLKGSVVSTFLILLIPEALRFLEIPSSVLGPLRQMIYALILFAILMFKPTGFFGKIKLKD